MANPLRAVANWISARLSPASQPKPAREVAANYDAAQTTRHNQNHWGNSDALSPNASNTPGVRRTLRNRSRYEAANNPVYGGVIRTIADHTIGTGPKIQFLSPDSAVNARLASLWEEWTSATGLANKLWLMKETQVRDGECFLLQIGNPALESRVQLDYQLLEADYVTSLRPVWTPWQVDGITYDPQWNPISYQIVTQRANDVLPIVWPQQHKVDAKYVIHYLRQERPGQGRGIPELMAAFELLAVLRRYIAATVSAAEVAASFAAFIKSQSPAVGAGDGTGSGADDWLTLDIQRNLITMLPEGYDIGQIKPEQPTQSFTDFVKTCITLLTRIVSMPLNIAMGDSSGYNFSSGRLDHQTYYGSIDIDRANRIQPRVLERMLGDFLAEAEFILGFPHNWLHGIAHEWHWPPPVSIDPDKETSATRAQMEIGLVSIPDAQKQANTGGDVVRENAEYFGVSEQEMRKAMFNKIFGDKPAPASLPGATSNEPSPADQGKKPTAGKPPFPPNKAEARATSLACAAPDIEIKGAGVHAGLTIAAAQAGDANAVPKFKMLAYSGGPMNLDGHEYPVIIDLATCIVASDQTPILYEHDPEREVGHSPTVTIDSAGIRADGVFSGASPERDRVVTAAKRKYPWQASIGGRAEHIDVIPEGESVTVNGRQFTGPVEVAYGVKLREISVLSLGADSSTSVLAATGKRAAQIKANAMGFEEWVTSMGFIMSDLSEQQKQSLMNEWQSKQAATQAGDEPGNGDADQKEEETEGAESEEDADQPDEQQEAAADDEANEDRADEQTGDEQASEDEAEEEDKTEASEEDDAENKTEASDEPDDDGDEEKKKTKAAAKKFGWRVIAASAPKPKKKATKMAKTVQAADPKKHARQYVEETRKLRAAEMKREIAIRRAAGDNHDLAAKAIEEGWTAEKVELHVLRAHRPKGVLAGPLARGSAGDGPDMGAVIECSLLQSGGVKEGKLAELDRRYTADVIAASSDRDNRGYSLTRLVHQYLAANGRYTRGGSLDNDEIRAALHLSKADDANRDIQAASDGFSTVSLSGILSNLLNKSLLVSYLAVPTASQEFCGAQDLNDFKVATRYRLSMSGTIQKVGPTGELKSAQLGDESWTNQLDTYGTLMTLNRQMLINDDLDALMQLPRLLGRQAALAIEESVFTLLLANANASDGFAFFSTQHGNIKTGAGSALAIQSLTDALVLFLKQTDAQGKPIVLSPAALLVPPENKILADQLYKDTNIVTLLGTSTAAGKVVPQSNPHANKYKPVSSPYLSNGILANNSSTGWYLLADPADVPMISIGYLRGQRTPTVDQGQADMDILGFRWRIYFDYGVGAVEYRAGVYSAGA